MKKRKTIKTVMKLSALFLRIRTFHLVLIAFLGFVVLALGFGIIRFLITSNAYDLNSFFSAVATSFEEQAMIPGSPVKGADRVLRFLQAVSANVYLAIIVGVVTFRMLQRKENVMFPSRLAYNHLRNAFEFRFINVDASDISDVYIRAFIRKRISRSADRLIRNMMFPLKLNMEFEPYVESMMVVAFRTTLQGQKGHVLQTDCLNQITLDVDSTVVITVSGISVDSGNSIVARKIYRFEDIVVGSYRDTESELGLDAFGNPDSWKQRNYDLFEEIEGVAIPAFEWRSKHVREGIASIRIDDHDHIIHYPAEGNAEFHIKNILDGNIYKPIALLEYTPSTIIDVGANVGASAVFFRSLYPMSRIYCFEPDTSNFQYIKRNLSGLKGVTLRSIGLYNSSKEVTLFRGKSQCLQHSIFRSAEVTSEGEQIQLKDALKELENIIDENTLLKIDAEGCEYPILTRLQAFLGNIKVIYLEFHSEKDRIQIDELLRPTHGLWSCSMKYAHRGDVCYVHRELWEGNEEIQSWIVHT